MVFKVVWSCRTSHFTSPSILLPAHLLSFNLQVYHSWLGTHKPFQMIQPIRALMACDISALEGSLKISHKHSFSHLQKFLSSGTLKTSNSTFYQMGFLHILREINMVSGDLVVCPGTLSAWVGRWAMPTVLWYRLLDNDWGKCSRLLSWQDRLPHF